MNIEIRPRALLKIVLINVVILLLLVEFGGAAYYTLTRGSFFYTRDRSGPAPDPNPWKVLDTVFHPYFGYINRISPAVGAGGQTVNRGVNNDGFQFSGVPASEWPQCCLYPTRHDDNEIVVAIFGGSVGAGFALTAEAHQDMIERLEAIPAYAGKRVRILNFAIAGFRQPQQLMVLAFYLARGQTFDVVINLDGFNEVVTTQRNYDRSVEPLFPADDIWGDQGRRIEKANIHLAGPEQIRSLYRLQIAQDARRAAEQCATGICYIWNKVRELYNYRIHQDLNQGTDVEIADSSQFITKRNLQFTETGKFDIYDFTAHAWAASSIAMRRLVEGAGGIYLHVLQPNQWFAPAGQYTPLSPDHAYKWVIDPVNKGYNALLQQKEDLHDAGVDFLDAGALLDATQNDLFIDDCCHYSEKGNRILFEAVAEELEARLASPPMPNEGDQ